ncbi:PAS domain-containing sensor histidine kinase [Larkinella sp. VNQ87]|uniref:PAS domain-containing sensor histidine kinase n=1 Tax=Larkinella sp. VNQ87 TaxID=3400921 RepID=UPI003C0D0476
MITYIRVHDWSASRVGPREAWPTVLHSTLAVMLPSRFPMILYWGPDRICFYNDAFAAFLKLLGKHPAALGERAEAVWGESWSLILPQIEHVERGEGATWLEDQCIPVLQSGQLRDTFWTSSYSPVSDESGKPAGVLVTCLETTAQVVTRKTMKDTDERLEFALESARLGTWDFHPVTQIVTWDNRTRELFGFPKDEIIPFEHVLNFIAPEDHPLVKTAIDRALDPAIGERLNIQFRTLGAEDGKVRWVHSIGQAHFKDGTPYRFSGIVLDLTDRITAEQDLQASERRMLNMVLEAPVATAIYIGEEMVIQLANETMLNLWGKDASAIGKTVDQALPELDGQPFMALLQNVYRTGVAYRASEDRCDLVVDGQLQTFYFNFTYKPLTDSNGQVYGIMNMAVDVTEQVMIRKKIELSETRQKLAIEAAGLGTFDWDMIKPEFTFSQRLAQMFGYTETVNLEHISFSGLIHPDDRQIRLDAHAEAIRTGRLFYEARFVWLDQSVHWIRLNGKVLYTEEGKPSRMYGTTMDITDQKNLADWLEKQVEERTLTLQQRNEELKRSEERYHKMVDEVQDYAILLLNREGIIQNWNQGAERIKGYSEAEIVGKSIRVFYRPEDREKGLPERLIDEALREGRATHEGWRLRKNGSEFWGNTVITALHDEQGSIIGFSKVTRDLTEKKLAEDQLWQYSRDLELQNKELEQFAYIASHDLQEPLRKIQTFSGLLRESLDQPELVDRYLGKIDSSAQRMSTLIREVLNYSRLTMQEERFVPVDLNAILQAVLVDLELLVEQKGAEIQAETLPTIDGVPLQLGQLFYNLISNSLKFTEKRPMIRISARILTPGDLAGFAGLKPTQTYVELRFEDNGIGFEPHFAQQIFVIFQRLNTSKRYGGTGIGLALCKKIVDNHQGQILAQSEPGQGAVFLVQLPCSRQAGSESNRHLQ